MAETTTLARPYARAAFEVALQDKDLETWSRTLALAAAITGQPTVNSVLRDPSLSSAQIADSFIGVCEDDIQGKGRNFIRLLAENKRLLLLSDIAEIYEALKADQQRSVDVELTTAFEISPEAAESLGAALRTRLERDINLATKVDQALIGGAIIRTGDMVIDSSVRGKLTKLVESINS
jgi:F-type H+-transporting ATPase subunit delta